jgi:hypothetical protein
MRNVNQNLLDKNVVCVNRTHNSYYKQIKQGHINPNRRGKLRDIDQLDFDTTPDTPFNFKVMQEEE